MSENTEAEPCTLGRGLFPVIRYAPIMSYAWRGFIIPAWAVEAAQRPDAHPTDAGLVKEILRDGEAVREPEWLRVAG